MSDSTPNLDYILGSQSGKETTANAAFDALSPSSVYGRRMSTCSGLVWGYYGGVVSVNGAPTTIANGTLTLTASTTVYVEASQTTGTVYQNNTGWTAGRTPLYLIVAGTATVTSYTDMRMVAAPMQKGYAVTVSGNIALQYEASNCNIILLNGTPSAGFTVAVASRPWLYTVRNNTGQAATLGAGLTTVVIAAGKIAQVMTDGTDIYRVTADI